MTVRDEREYRRYMERVASIKGTILAAKMDGFEEGLAEVRAEQRGLE